MKKKILIIGGGASGMAAAIWAAKSGADVTILEHMDRVGKKSFCSRKRPVQSGQSLYGRQLLPFGTAGFSIKSPETVRIRGYHPLVFQYGLRSKGQTGLLLSHVNQASAVLDVLRMSLKEYQVQVICGFLPYP